MCRSCEITNQMVFKVKTKENKRRTGYDINITK